MSQRAVERAVGKLVTDEGFREAFARFPERTAHDAGLELTASELRALMSIPLDALLALGARLDDRICCIHVPHAHEETPS